MADRPVWTTALPDWERRIVRRESMLPCEPLFPSEAAAGMAVFDELRLVDVAGSPPMGQISRPWAREFVASIFGAYDPETDRRLIREWFLLISKKNSKSSLAAGVMMTALLLNWRQSGEFGILAPTVEVANNAYKPARDMVKADEELSDLLHVQDHIRTITHRQTGATLQVVAADSETVAGKKWIGTLVDELWLFGKRANAARMLEEATGGMASRPEGFVIYLSTQSDEPPAGVFKEKLAYARGVRDGRIKDPQFCPVLFEFPAEMLADKAYLREENYYVTNPNLGASVDEEFIQRKFRQAGEAGQENFQMVLSKFLNVEIGLALQSDRWVAADYWLRCADVALSLPEILRRSDVLQIGIDFGGADDWFALCVLGRDERSGDWLHWGKAWAHRDAFDRRKGEASRWLDFVEQGDLVRTETLGQELTEAVTIVLECDATGKLDKVAADSYKVQSLDDALVAAGFDTSRLVGVPQGWKLVGAVYAAERKMAAGKFWHCWRPIMGYAVANAKAVLKGNNIVIEKQAAGSAKIDPVLALLHASAVMSMAPAQNIVGADYEMVTA